MFTEHKKKIRAFTDMSKGYIRLLNISKVCAFSLHMIMVYTYILIDSISEIYTYVPFDVVNVDV